MKIAITGHTSGIGKAITDYFIGRGDEVIGFSRSNGYQLPQMWKEVVEAAIDCDIFVNNARVPGLLVADMSQTRILHKLCNVWRGQEKRIINIGSISGLNPLSPHPIYSAQKAALRTMAKVMQSKQLRPRIFHLDFGRILTERTKNDEGPKVPVENIIKVIDFYLSFPHDILDMTFRHRENLSPVT